jgi:hypothetical protein
VSGSEKVTLLLAFCLLEDSSKNEAAGLHFIGYTVFQYRAGEHHTVGLRKATEKPDSWIFHNGNHRGYRE